MGGALRSEDRSEQGAAYKNYDEQRSHGSERIVLRQAWERDGCGSHSGKKILSARKSTLPKPVPQQKPACVSRTEFPTRRQPTSPWADRVGPSAHGRGKYS